MMQDNTGFSVLVTSNIGTRRKGSGLQSRRSRANLDHRATIYWDTVPSLRISRLCWRYGTQRARTDAKVAVRECGPAGGPFVERRHHEYSDLEIASHRGKTGAPTQHRR